MKQVSKILNIEYASQRTCHSVWGVAGLVSTGIQAVSNTSIRQTDDTDMKRAQYHSYELRLGIFDTKGVDKVRRGTLNVIQLVETAAVLVDPANVSRLHK